MNTNRIIIGNLINNHLNNTFCGTYVFLESNNKYFLLDDIKNIFTLLKYKINKSSIRTFDTDPNKKLYIDKESIKSYYSKQSHKTLKMIKNDYLLDSRNPKGINY